MMQRATLPLSTLARALFGSSLLLAALATPATVGAAMPATLTTPVPAHVFSPYFETWTTDTLTSTAQHSGARYFTLAFLETLGQQSCTLAWNGESGRRVGSGAYVSDIASLRGLGGDVIPSFGGWTADQQGREIGDSCRDVSTIAKAYEKVITTYGVSRLDMDIEGRSLSRTNGIDRRNRAIKLVQDWAIAHGRPLTIAYTLPTSRNGLDADALAVLHNAVANGVRIDVVQPMVFDYYDGKSLDMGDSAISALRGLHAQLAALLPAKTSAQIWALEGAIIMNGRDDYPTKIETTTIHDAKQLLAFAQSNGLAALSMWAIQRDNGRCPGVAGSGDCSGISQTHWAFTRVLSQISDRQRSR